MASLTGKTHLFFTTSPRSPHKMKEEINLLTTEFSGKNWRGNANLQTNFFRKLIAADFYEGSRKPNFEQESDEKLAFAARDRITRAPKALGFVSLNPIYLTEAGRAYLAGPRPAEAFTRQLLKFQFPSPYHIDKGKTYQVKPYLELLRLTYELDGISKDEIAAFVTQLVDYEKYEQVKEKIVKFRRGVKRLDHGKINYSRYFDKNFSQEMGSVYAHEIAKKQYKTRESTERSLDKFLSTKKRNHRDYADAAIRYLRETKLVTLRSSRSQHIYIPPDKLNEVEFILENTARNPVFVTSKVKYQEYLFDASIPTLLSDDKAALVNDLVTLPGAPGVDDLWAADLNSLKEIKDKLILKSRKRMLEQQVQSLQSYAEFQDIMKTYQAIVEGNTIDGPIWMEWNTWRAFTMLNDGEIIGNFRLDDAGMPLSTASGNQADIIGSYLDFDLTIEVTLSTGATQFKMESDSVPRHFAKHKQNSGKETYTIFIAKSLNKDTITYFYSLHGISLAGYGGRARIIPLSLEDFKAMLKHANQKPTKPTAKELKNFVACISKLASSASDEFDWYKKIQLLTPSWTDVSANCTS